MKAPYEAPRQKPWYLLTGFVFGLIGGLLIAWLIAPVQYVDTPPSSLRADAKDQYRVMIALSYGVTGDLTRAKARLAVLDGSDELVDGMPVDPLPTSAQWLAAQAQRALANGRPQTEVQALGILAGALGEKPTPLPSLTPTAQPSPTASVTQTQAPASPTSSPTQVPPSATVAPSQTTMPFPSATPTVAWLPSATSTVTPEASATPTSPAKSSIETQAQAHDATLPVIQTPSRTPMPSYDIQSRKLVCDPGLEKSQIQVQVKDASGNGVPGVKIYIDWDNGQDTFITGLKPEIGRGYADFTMTPGFVYTLRLTESGQPLSGIEAEECTTSRGKKYWGSWSLTFTQGK